MENDKMEYWSTELWQIVRYHARHIKVEIELSPAFGTPSWHINLYYKENLILFDSGVNLWKRLKKATETLHELLKEKVYEYEA